MEPNDQPSAQAQETKPAVAGAPASWPGAFGAYKYSKAAVMQNLAPILVLIVLSIVVSAVPSEQKYSFENLLVSVVAWILSLFFSIALTRTLIAGVRQQAYGLGRSLKEALDPLLWLKYFGLSILVGLTVLVGLVLLVVPGIIFAARLSLAQYYLVDKKMGVIEAYKASWGSTKGSVMKVLGIVGVTILFVIAILVIVGLYFLLMYAAALAVLYQFLLNQPAGAAATPAPPAASGDAPAAAPAA